MAVAVTVAVSGGVAAPVAVPVAVPVAGLTKRFFNHPKRFLNQCLGSTITVPICAMIIRRSSNVSTAAFERLMNFSFDGWSIKTAKQRRRRSQYCDDDVAKKQKK